MSQLKIFIGWSKEPSGEISGHLAELIRDCVGPVDIFRSHKIPKGVFSGLEISGSLDESLVGAFCLTRNNKHSHWMHWEAGALSAGMKQGGDESDPSKKRVCPILFGLKNYELDKPFQDLQATDFENPDDMKALIDGLAKRHEGANTQTSIDKHWKNYWPPFQAAVTDLLKKAEESGDDPPADQLEEWQERLLQLTLRIKQGLESGVDLSTRDRSMIADGFRGGLRGQVPSPRSESKPVPRVAMPDTVVCFNCASNYRTQTPSGILVPNCPTCGEATPGVFRE